MTTILNLNSKTLKDFFNEFTLENGFSSVLLTDSTGFPIIHSSDDINDAETTAAIVSKIQQAISQVKDLLDMNILEEVTMLDNNGKRLVIRSFVTNSSTMFMVFIIPNRTIPYKRTMKKILQTITTEWAI